MTDRNNNEAKEELQAPPALVRALKQIPPQEVFVPSYVDAAVLKAARQQLASSTPSRRHIFHWLLWPALATCVILALRLTLPATARYAAGDINRDGHVDILDSFALARDLKSGNVSPTLDVNGDGVVDQRDVDAVAVRAVRLEKTSS